MNTLAGRLSAFISAEGHITAYQLLGGVRRSHAVTKANDVTRRAKVAKVYLLPKHAVTIAAELFVNEPEQLDAFLYRLLRLVHGVSWDYFSRLKQAPVSV